MEDTIPLLRKLVEQQPLEEQPLKLKPFCDKHDLPYFRMRDFMQQRGPGLRLEQAEKLCKILTGKPLRLLGKGAA